MGWYLDLLETGAVGWDDAGYVYIWGSGHLVCEF